MRFIQTASMLLCLSLAGCVSYTPSGPLGSPEKLASSPLPRGAQVADVVISAPGLAEDTRKGLSGQLTEQISQYVDRGAYFNRVVVFPGKLGDQDVILKFNLTSLKGQRQIHPAYFPGAILTATMWIWVNGPVSIDKTDLAGELIIEDRQGKRLARVTEQVRLDKNIGIWDDEYTANLGATQLRALITKLLDAATAAPQLATH